MRYSMLVTLLDMSRTLLEAAQYLRTAPDDGLRAELMQNGRQMMGQIQDALSERRSDLRSDMPLKQLEEAAAQWESGGEALEERLNQFIRELPQQTRYQVRAVFFAELGEKWDAMQSVYEYMRNDLRFDPVVVRTPVGRVVQRDGRQEQEILYKDFLTPIGVPSFGYEEYDIASDCPEVAFISQPYESVTLEQFWPENIAKHTRLVYLPYYLPDMVRDAHILTLAQMPVYQFAWKVVCANRKHYNFYCRHAANKGVNALVTGLPKTDPFVWLRRKPALLPDGWEALNGKTVILWNSWYDLGASSLQYFESLLEWFEAHKDCALLWRPHPMSDTVIKLYYPDRYPVYQEMLRRVEAEENMLLDNQTSCFAAFSLSNAMISDYSSLLPQYLLLDKPALWMRNKAIHLTGEEFIDGRWMEQANRAEDILAFLDRVRNGEDRNAEMRSAVRRRDLSLADGRCGERVCTAVWEALRGEFL